MSQFLDSITFQLEDLSPFRMLDLMDIDLWIQSTSHKYLKYYPVIVFDATDLIEFRIQAAKMLSYFEKNALLLGEIGRYKEAKILSYAYTNDTKKFNPTYCGYIPTIVYDEIKKRHFPCPQTPSLSISN